MVYPHFFENHNQLQTKLILIFFINAGGKAKGDFPLSLNFYLRTRVKFTWLVLTGV